MEHHISEIIHYFLTFLIILVLISVALLGKEINDINAFKNYVNTSIERHGGYTDQAELEVVNYSQKYYQDLFKINSVSQKGRVNYGQEINYVIQAYFPVAFFRESHFIVDFYGQASSRLRSE
ncbi:MULTISPECIES: hypothetical protein [unclassified Enterococcus]|uniref:hypothetical protein n=1 Tax=unclassified Enterococcus TaxID=2608891 RepID=UPI0015581F3D|nr:MULTISPECIES: hypothetical protein [unclassified Enterococcus]MBS7576493.1 hypothetical protein [Enterococcus sp. MMGLQ5-2]MBS7583725.1 hypothetical protein [Enterococcus sp. MMGLQ5-1]NPD11586.1 hypothetical protein [Enterococcus sp. MMGLQ5-1]NPD36330.1 hypothetical protein [Enterococcus sp. MMGLQ5-2]